MNNKGFTITTTLMGSLILFLLLLVSVLDILSLRMNNLEKLTDSSDVKSSRNSATMKAETFEDFNALKKAMFDRGDDATGGLFCLNNVEPGSKRCRYYSRASLLGVSDDVYIKESFNLDDDIIGHAFDVRYGGYYEVYACGAGGGDAYDDKGNFKAKGGKGTCIKSYIKLSAGDSLFFNIGGRGNNAIAATTGKVNALGGYNGGGGAESQNKLYSAGSGGGSTDIRLGEDYYDTAGDEIPSKMDGTTKIYYGPNYRAASGTYYVDIYGENLSSCAYEVYANGEKNANTATIRAKYPNGLNHYVVVIHALKETMDSGLEIYASQTQYETSNTKCVITREAFSKIENRVLVAAGGGGSGYYNDSLYTIGGNGGVITGFNGINVIHGVSTDAFGTRAGQINGGYVNDPNGGGKKNFYNGGTGAGNSTGGGGGYWGGDGPNTMEKASGGGSSFVSGVAGMNALTKLNNGSSSYYGTQTESNQPLHFNGKYFFGTTFEPGINEGDGKASIKYLGTTEPERNGLLNNVRYVRDCVNGYTYQSGTNTYSIDNWFKSWQEMQIIKNGVNIVKNVLPYASTRNDGGYKYEFTTDGKIQIMGSFGAIQGNSARASTLFNYEKPQCLAFDLGKEINIDEIAVWHAGHANVDNYYKYNVIEVSSDGKNWTLFDFSNMREGTDGKRINAWELFPEERVTKRNNVWLTYDYAINNRFGVREYFDTGYNIDFSKTFEVDAGIKIPALGKYYIIFSNRENSGTNVPHLVVGIDTDNRLYLMIDNNTVARSPKNSIFANETIHIKFNWNAEINKFTLSADGINTHVVLDNRTVANDTTITQSTYPPNSIDWSKDFELNAKVNIPGATEFYIAGNVRDSIALNNRVTILSRYGKIHIYIRKNDAYKEFQAPQSITYNEDIDVNFKWHASTNTFELTAKGKETDIYYTMVDNRTLSPRRTLLVGMADYRSAPENNYKNPITYVYFKISTLYNPDTTYYDLPTDVTMGRDVVSSFDASTGEKLTNGMKIPSTDKTYRAKWTTNYVNVTYDYNIDKEYGYNDVLDTKYVIDWNKDFMIDMDFIMQDPSKLIYLIDADNFRLITESTNKNLYVSFAGTYSNVNIPAGELVHMRFVWSAFFKKYKVTLTSDSINDTHEGIKNNPAATSSIKIQKLPKNEIFTVKSLKITDVYLKGTEFSKFPTGIDGDSVGRDWQDGSGNTFIDGTTTRANNTTYTLSWIENKFRVTLDAGNGTIIPKYDYVLGDDIHTASKDFVYGKTYGSLPTPALAGKSFGGWYLDDGTTKINADSRIPYAFDHTLHARWN